jgi:hypothetical protein
MEENGQAEVLHKSPAVDMVILSPGPQDLAALTTWLGTIERPPPKDIAEMSLTDAYLSQLERVQLDWNRGFRNAPDL